MNAVGRLVTCEHAGNRVPAEFQCWFRGRGWLLASHRGWDPGALELARHLARAWDAPLHISQMTRLLVDVNRTAPRNAFSAVSRRWDRPLRERALAAYYWPYRRSVEARIETIQRHRRCALHLSVHTFVPVLYGRPRPVDIGLLYDPRRSGERQWCRSWQERLQDAFPAWRIRLNQPYRGTDDGFTTFLRTRWPDTAYAGIELEVNQRLFDAGGPRNEAWFRGVAASLCVDEERRAE